MISEHLAAALELAERLDAQAQSVDTSTLVCHLRVLVEDMPPKPLSVELCCKIGCDALAEFLILTVRKAPHPPFGSIAGPNPYADDTFACAGHVGDLLGYQPGALSPEDIYWEVLPWPDPPTPLPPTPLPTVTDEHRAWLAFGLST